MANTQITPLWIAIAGSLGVGSFVGSLITLFFSSRQRHQEWVNDNKKQEWRELTSTLSRSFHYILNYSQGVIDGEQMKGTLQADVDAVSVIEDRFFISPQMQRENILERWRLLVAENDWSRKVAYWNALHSTLVAVARKDCGIK